MPYCDTECFEVFLHELAKKNPKEYKILFLDNGAFYKAKRLEIPENIALCFLLPYSPELNPAEKIWAFIKKKITNKAFKTMELLQAFLDNAINKYIIKEIVETISHTSTYENIFNQIVKR
jgi:transposase